MDADGICKPDAYSEAGFICSCASTHYCSDGTCSTPGHTCERSNNMHPDDPEKYVRDELGNWGPPKPTVEDVGDAAYPASEAVRRMVQMEQQARLLYEAEEMAMGSTSNVDGDTHSAPGRWLSTVEWVMRAMQPAPVGFPGVQGLGSETTSIQLFERVS